MTFRLFSCLHTDLLVDVCEAVATTVLHLRAQEEVRLLVVLVMREELLLHSDELPVLKRGCIQVRSCVGRSFTL